MKELQLTGTYFDAGYALGKAMKRPIRGYLLLDRKTLLHAAKKYNKQIERTYDMLNMGYKDRVDEMAGIAEGAGVPFIEVLLENMPEILYKDSGCTTVAVKNTFGNFIIHNEDEFAWRKPSNYALAHYNIAGGAACHVFCSPPELSGNAFGWNDKIFYAVDYVPVATINLRGIPRYIESRGMLEQTSIAGAISYLNNCASMSGWHYTIGEFGAGRIVSIERRHDKISMVEIESFNRHANHYIHESFAKKGEVRRADWTLSNLRLELVDTHIKLDQPPQTTTAMMRKYLKRPINNADHNKTFATVIANLNTGNVKII